MSKAYRLPSILSVLIYVKATIPFGLFDKSNE